MPRDEQLRVVLRVETGRKEPDLKIDAERVLEYVQRETRQLTERSKQCQQRTQSALARAREGAGFPCENWLSEAGYAIGEAQRLAGAIEAYREVARFMAQLQANAATDQPPVSVPITPE